MVRFVKVAYSKLFKEKFFNKIMLVYILIVLVILYMFTTHVSRNTSVIMREKQVGINRQVMKSLQEHINTKFDIIRDIIVKIYADSRASGVIFNLLEDSEDDIQVEKREEIVRSLDSITDIDRDIKNIVIYKKLTRSTYLFLKEMAIFNRDDGLAKQYYQLGLEGDETRVVPTHTSIYKLYGSTVNIFGFVKNIVYPWGGIGGKILVEFDARSFERIFNEYQRDVRGYVVVLTDDGNVLFDSSGRYYNRKYPFIDLLKSSATSAKLEEDSFIDTIRSEQGDIIYASIIPMAELYRNINMFTNTTYVISVASILLVFILFYMATRIFTGRVREVIRGMKEVGGSNFNYRIRVKNRKDEIGQIAEYFNSMCGNLKEYIDKAYVYEIRQKNSELSMLQSQINPHFLYNSLEAIRARAVKDGSRETGEMIHALALLFRSLIKGDTIVDIFKELEYCRMYLKIFSIRYEDYFYAEFDISDEIHNFGILKNMLQPVLENYILYGFDPAKRDNRVIVKGFKQGNDIVLQISDNGKGICREKLKDIKDRMNTLDIKDSSSIGLANVNERIKIVFGFKYGLEIDSTEGMGTMVTIRIPSMTKDEIKEIMGVTEI